ncbi:MAG TPA: DUF6175 family protein [Myxococcota bacterium]|nr:DUF6175 family protein [Myxococcota bacterium]HOC98359.1 DUF6175 family protein [Myxococcota bacterium]HOH77900.1 DUF6175 family protein [Myxococcota bacterium]
MSRLFSFLSVFVAVSVLAVAGFAQTVKLVSADTDTAKYRIDGAAGIEQEGAVATAVEAALNFAASEVTGDPNEKLSAQAYVKKNLAQLNSFATPGQIFKRGFDASGDKMMVGMFVMVDIKGLKAHLVAAGVTTTGAQLSDAVGKPKLLVVYNQGDCARGSETSPICAIPAKIKEFNAEVEKNEAKIDQLFEKVTASDCLRPTELRASSKTTDKAEGSASVSARRTAVGGGGMFHSWGASRTSVRASASFKRSTTTEAAMELIQASPNCKVFIDQAGGLLRENQAIKAKRDQAQDELERLRAQVMDSDTTTLRVNKWLIGEQWDIVDADAINKAQRSLDAMTSTEGIPADPVAATALLAGADVYVVHDFKETSPGGAYQLVFSVKAYDVVTGKLLASTVESSNKMFNEEKENATAKAIGKAMPVVINQILSYWSSMAEKGVPTKIVLRGQFTNDIVDTIEEFLDERLVDVIGKSDCMGSCKWNSEMTTKQTISGTYVLPASKRQSMLRKLRRSLSDEGLEYDIVVQSPTLAILQIL